MLDLIVNTKELEDTLKKIEAIIPKKPEIKILNGVKIEIKDNVLSLEATDLKNTVYAKMQAEEFEEGNVVLSSIKDIVKSFKFFIECKTRLTQVDNSTIKIINGEKTIKLRLLDTEAFPALKKPEFDNTYYNYKENKLYNRIKEIDYARIKDETRPYLNGMYFNKTDIVAMDGYRLALNKDDTLSVEESFIMNPDCIDYLKKVLERKREEDIVIFTNNEYIKLDFDNIELVSKKVEGKYFDYEAVTDVDTKAVNFNKKKLEDNIKFLEVHNSSKKGVMKISLKNSVANFEINTENGTITADMNTEKNVEIEQHFNNKFFLEALKNIKGEIVEYNFTRRYNPCMLKNENSIHLILPVRISA